MNNSEHQHPLADAPAHCLATTFTVYAFTDDAPHVVRAECEMAALELAPVPCYCLVEIPCNPADKRFMAMAAADDVFEIPNGHWSSDPATAVAALKQRRADIHDHQDKRNSGNSGSGGAA